MRIVAVDAQAFGPFAESRLELTPGLNVVVGPNEAGKSSWHAAIHAGLCGIRRGVGRRNRYERDFVERHQPWQGEAWLVVLKVELDDGQQLEFRQDLAGISASSVTDLVTGRDLTGDLLHDGAPDAAGTSSANFAASERSWLLIVKLSAPTSKCPSCSIQ